MAKSQIYANVCLLSASPDSRLEKWCKQELLWLVATTLNKNVHKQPFSVGTSAYYIKNQYWTEAHPYRFTPTGSMTGAFLYQNV